MEAAMVSDIVSRHGTTSVSARQFFISWNSVATLAYRGFSRTLLAVKRALEDGIAGLRPENAGSLWPKTTLGCLREQITLSEAQVHSLRRLCLQHTAAFNNVSEGDCTLDIRELSLVTFHCRTLERRLTSENIVLAGERTEDDRPPQVHVDAVARTMAQFDDERHAEYYPQLAPQGRTIDTYYRVPHIETTLVYDLRCSPVLIRAIRDFQSAVDEELPDRYAWFEPTSWHMTVRALLSNK
jgi:hypothetical protein